jgi:uncharacterized membrane protein YfcA
LSAGVLIASSAIVFLAFFVRGISGFGSATIAIPLLAHFIALKLAVPLLLIHDLLSTLATVSIDRRAVDRSEILWLLPPSIAGVIIGVTLLVTVPAQPLLAALGALVIVFGIRTLINPQGDKRISRLWAIPAGLAGGALGGAFGSGAATPSMIYLTHRLADKSRVRGTFSGFAIFDYTLRIIIFAVAGVLLSDDLLLLVSVTLPAMMLGLYTGNKLHGRISTNQAFKVIGTLLVVSGLSLLWKALS